MVKSTKITAIGLALSLLLTGCGASQTQTAGMDGNEISQVEMTPTPENTPIVESTPMEESAPAETNDSTEDGVSVGESDRAEENNLLGGDSMDEQTFHNGDEGKQVVIYFANWNLGNSAADASGEVGNIPWDKVTYVNHAFWAVAPADGSTETSFVRRDSGEGARTEFAIVSTDPYKDYQNTGKSAINPELEKNHFAQYAAYSELYPDVNIMISVGGWGACGYFSEMAYTKEGAPVLYPKLS